MVMIKRHVCIFALTRIQGQFKHLSFARRPNQTFAWHKRNLVHMQNCLDTHKHVNIQRNHAVVYAIYCKCLLMHMIFQNDPSTHLCLFRVSVYLTKVAGQSGVITPRWQDKESRGYSVSWSDTLTHRVVGISHCIHLLCCQTTKPGKQKTSKHGCHCKFGLASWRFSQHMGTSARVKQVSAAHGAACSQLFFTPSGIKSVKTVVSCLNIVLKVDRQKQRNFLRAQQHWREVVNIWSRQKRTFMHYICFCSYFSNVFPWIQMSVHSILVHSESLDFILKKYYTVKRLNRRKCTWGN